MRHRGLLALRCASVSGGRVLPCSPPHHLPELVEVVQRRHALEPLLQLVGQIVIGRAHVGEFGATERLAVAVRHLDAVEHVREGDDLAVGHVGVPVLPGVGEADRSAVLDDVGQDHHLGEARLLIGVGDVDLQRAEARAKRLQSGRVDLLVRKQDHAMSAERFQNGGKVRFAQRLREVDAGNRGAKGISVRGDRDQEFLLNLTSSSNMGEIRRVRNQCCGSTVFPKRKHNSPR